MKLCSVNVFPSYSGSEGNPVICPSANDCLVDGHRIQRVDKVNVSTIVNAVEKLALPNHAKRVPTHLRNLNRPGQPNSLSLEKRQPVSRALFAFTKEKLQA